LPSVPLVHSVSSQFNASVNHRNDHAADTGITT